MSYDYEVTAVIPASPETLFEAWMNGEIHLEMTGGAAGIDPRVGGDFTTWGGCIQRSTIEPLAPTHIVQAWRRADFAENHVDSIIEVAFAAIDVGAAIVIRNSLVRWDLVTSKLVAGVTTTSFVRALWFVLTTVSGVL
jgi:uncharacterized protein YndB with AHSA1/START domain